jgi:hypothetical protein
MAFADTRDAQFNFDASGNKNNWTANNINSNASSESTYDIMNDVPTLTDEDTANYPVLNPLDPQNGTFSNGNLSVTTPTDNVGGTKGQIKATITIPSSGKWYWEAQFSANGNQAFLGVRDNLNNYLAYYGVNGYRYPADTAYGATFTTGDTIGVAVDVDGGTITYYKNNSSQGAITFDTSSGAYHPFFSDGTNTGTCSYDVNFGQRPFKYTPPTGYKKLNTYNLPDSTIADGSQYMNPVLYTGNGSTQSITGLGFSPDLVWLKNRSAAYNHAINDSVRGAGKTLESNTTNSEFSYSAFFTSLDSDGFSLAGGIGQFNLSGNAYASWSWRGSDSSAVSNTDGTITSTVSANTTSGFSVVTYTGNGTAGATVGHGLGSAPALMIGKNRTYGVNWRVYHQSLGATKYLNFNLTNSETTSSLPWNNTAPNSSVFTLGTSDNVNRNGDNIVMYCFAEVEGFSKFGSYTGNGSADGSFVYTGFRPAFVMVKQYTTTGNWIINDSGRAPYNLIPSALYPNLSNAEDVSHTMDLLSNGFKLRSTGDDSNGSGTGIIYMAFAENPFKQSLAR